MSEEELVPELKLEDDSHGVPVLPLRDVVVYPHMVIPLFVGRDKSIVALDKAMLAGKRRKRRITMTHNLLIYMKLARWRRSCSY